MHMRVPCTYIAESVIRNHYSSVDSDVGGHLRAIPIQHVPLSIRPTNFSCACQCCALSVPLCDTVAGSLARLFVRRGCSLGPLLDIPVYPEKIQLPVLSQQHRRQLVQRTVSQPRHFNYKLKDSPEIISEMEKVTGVTVPAQ